VAGISLGTAGQQGQSLQNAGAATASGYAGVANALSGGVQGIGQALSLQQLLQGNNWLNQGPYGIGGNGNLPMPPGTIENLNPLTPP
jgi:hypothetical protein